MKKHQLAQHGVGSEQKRFNVYYSRATITNYAFTFYELIFFLKILYLLRQKIENDDLPSNHSTAALGQLITAQCNVKFSPTNMVLFNKLSTGIMEGANGIVFDVAMVNIAILLNLVFLSMSFVALHLKKD